jgi:hypothetical protein
MRALWTPMGAAPEGEMADILADIWNLAGLVPDVHRLPWRDLWPSDDEAQMLAAEYPVQSYGLFDTPPWLAALEPLDRLQRAGRAVLDTLSACKPLFHRSLVQGRIIEASGTTILVTARGRPHDGHRGIVAVPWSAGESPDMLTGRFLLRRKLGAPRLSPAALAIARAYLPVWQAVVSIVPQAEPIASLMGSGGSTPTEMCIGTKRLTMTSEHRLYTPDDGALFMDCFFTFLEADRA